MLHAVFVMEQHIGHQTYYQNLRRFIECDTTLQASWVPITYQQAAGHANRWPLVPNFARGTMRGREQVKQGLQTTSGDIVFFNTQVPAVLGADFLRQPYLIATDLTPRQYDQLGEHYGHRADRFGPLKAAKHLANVRVLRGATRLLPWSKWAAQSLVDDYGVDPERVKVIPPGIDLEVWQPGAREHNGKFRILFVGGDLYRKGGESLLQAFRALPPGSAELHLVTRTRIPAEEGIQLYHDLKPNAPELIALYQSASVFVLPTRAEAFGIAAVEATAVGLAAIVTCVGGLTDVVADGENGFQIRPDDTYALTERLRRLAGDSELRNRMGQAARARAEAYFDARRNASAIASCLTEAASREPKVHCATV